MISRDGLGAAQASVSDFSISRSFVFFRISRYGQGVVQASVSCFRISRNFDILGLLDLALGRAGVSFILYTFQIF